MCSCHSTVECCVTFSGVKLSIRSFVLFMQVAGHEVSEKIKRLPGKETRQQSLLII